MTSSRHHEMNAEIGPNSQHFSLSKYVHLSYDNISFCLMRIAVNINLCINYIMSECRSYLKFISPSLTLTHNALVPFVTFSLLIQYKLDSVPLCYQNYIIVILFFMVAQCTCWKDFRRLKKSAARLIFQCREQNHISLLMSLHRPPIKSRIEYKLSAICHSFFLGLSHIYLSNGLLVYTPTRNLRSSSDNGILCILKLRTKTFWHCSFSFAARTIRNSLPTELRRTDSIQKFKSALKTHFYGISIHDTLNFVDLDVNHFN